jgi:transposase
MPKPYSLNLRERVVSYVEAGHSRRAAAAHFKVSASFVINLMTAFRERGAVARKALGGWRQSKLDPHRVFILRRVAEKDGISMPELAVELQAASGGKADPASLSRWLIRNGLSFKKSLQASECDRPNVLPLRARRGRLNDNTKCGPSPIGWSSSTKREPTRR